MTPQWMNNIDWSKEPLYQEIVRALADDITDGGLIPGSKLPTQRDLADKLGVAIGTITRAYSEAERKGLIHAEGRRGTFVGRPSETRSVFASMFEGGSRLYDLSRNHPSPETDPDLAKALKALSGRRDIGYLGQYAPSEGSERFRNIGAQWLSQLGVNSTTEDVILNVGAQQALTNAFAAVTEYGDTILTEELTYPGIRAIAELFGLSLKGVPIDREGINPDALESLCKQRTVRAMYINPTQHNPTGITLSLSRRKAIAELADKYDFVIVEDDLIRPLEKNPPPAIASIIPERTFFITSISKLFTSGLRVGFTRFPKEYRQKLIDYQRALILSPAELPAEIFAYWFENGTYDTLIERRRKDLTARTKAAREILGGYITGNNPMMNHLWLQLPENWTIPELSLELVRQGVAVAPAEIFAVNRSAIPNAVRISIAASPNLESLKKALKIIAETLERSPCHTTSTI